MKKPSERIQEIVHSIDIHVPGDQAYITAILQYLDEQAALEESIKPHQVNLKQVEKTDI